MKKFLLLLAVLVSLPLCGMAQSKFGIVNPEPIMRDLPDMAAAQKELQATAQKYQHEDSVLKAEIQLKYDDFQKLQNDASTPDAIKERRMQELQEMTNKLQQFTQNANQEMARQQEQLMGPIQMKLVNAIRAVGEAGAYTFIFTNEIPAFVGKDVIDVTADVRKQLGLK